MRIFHLFFTRYPGWIVTICLLLLPVAAQAHADGVGQSGFWNGFHHPISGLDHVLAMVSVGLWGAILGPPAVWVLPVAFPLIMTLGAVAGILGLNLPAVELGIILSVVLLGGVIAFKFRPGLPFAVLIVSFFAVFHGYAHGAELPENAGAVGYSIGFVVATGLLHLTGILLGLIDRLPFGDRVLQGGGVVIAVTGIFLLVRGF
ncbi:MAG: HupE/UreJ family protein [Candidatus Omnitrophica bacterium]|nr:HupE/UreJ family protein [Candidatus Omnitrophota bacterium]